MLLELAILKNFDAGTYKAGVQLAGSLTTYFDDVPVSRDIPTSSLVIGNKVILAIPNDNPKDACVIATWPNGTPPGTGDMLKSVYDTDDDGIVDAAELAANSAKLEGSTKAEVRDHSPIAHKTSHQDGGSDEMNVGGLSGELADPQKSNFLKLSDTPDSYTDQARKAVTVKPDQSGLEFITPFGWQLVDDHYFSSPATSYTINGLNGDVDIQYLITVFNVNGTGQTIEVLLRLNNDSGSNYLRQYLYAQGASIVAGADTVTGFYVVRSPAAALTLDPLMCLHAVSGQKRIMFGFRHSIDRWLSFISEWTNTIDNITSLVFAGSAPNAIGAGSRYTVWKRLV